MEQIERTEVRAGGKVESILAAATRTFLAGGFGAVSMDTIAREAGVSKATVYAHFAGKEDLFGAMVGRVCERYFETFSARELDPADVRASLTTLGRRFLDLVLSPDAIAVHRIIVAEVTRFPALGEVFWRAGPERTLRQIEAFMRRAAAAGRSKSRSRAWRPSNSSAWCAANSTCSICCVSNRVYRAPNSRRHCRRDRHLHARF